MVFSRLAKAHETAYGASRMHVDQEKGNGMPELTAAIHANGLFGGLVALKQEADAGDTAFSLATLGPKGTSSEAAARYAGERIAAASSFTTGVFLHDSFEAATNAVREGRADAVVIANAYSAINEAYMDSRLELAGAFIMATPVYGIAARPDAPVPLSNRIVTHPAPRDMISELLPPGFLVREVVLALSTSAAAGMVRDGEADLALTNETSRDTHGLRFVSHTRPIRMLWSIFTLRQAIARRVA